ncbi:MAG TPA: hypothetical protein DIT19_04585 [Desulfonauticus sp.]|jgi:hypothetical protein|nr:MAG: Uncharacterized protein XD41_0266 [Desulfonauticus sp. 38_4375]HCO12484.1 hypothetical protein [Desulfonauticus sp.]
MIDYVELTPEQEEQKRAIYNSLSERRKRFIDRIGYDKWNPFQEPKDPRKVKRDVTRRTVKQLFDEFLMETNTEEESNAFKQGVLEICRGLVNRDEKIKGMYSFCIWYCELLKKEGKSLDDDEF